MNKLSNAIDRFCIKHPYWGIPNLMRYIVIGTVAVYLLYLLTGYNIGLYQLLAFSPYHILHGQVWRLVTFIFLPSTTSPISLILMLYFYYWIGGTLENQWGTPKFTIYYISGVVLTILGAVITTLITGNNTALMSTGYVNLSMFFAFAALYPDAQVLLFFFIPIKIKWLAYLDAAFFVINTASAIGQHDWGGAVTPVIAILNFLVFFWPYLTGSLRRQRVRSSRQATRFRQTVKASQQAKPYHHKCAVCGKTDTDYPNMSFRYCSRCAGYHCYCEEHIFNHVHFTEDDGNNTQ